MRSLRKYNQGHNLVEVLISLLVLSVGLLGLAGLQVTSLQYSYDANARSLASIAAYDIIDRMRANIYPSQNPAARAAIVDGYVGGATCGGVAGCCDQTAATVANDLMCWTEFLENNLPGGTGTITGPDALANYTVTINWMERESGTQLSQTWTFRP